MVKIPGPLLEPLADALEGLRRKHPGMSADEDDAFVIGFWAGAMAFDVGLTEDISGNEIADRVATELWKGIDKSRDRT